MKMMSVTTAVPSFLKASDGRRIAPIKSARVWAGELVSPESPTLWEPPLEMLARPGWPAQASKAQPVHELPEPPEKVQEKTDASPVREELSPAEGAVVPAVAAVKESRAPRTIVLRPIREAAAAEPGARALPELLRRAWWAASPSHWFRAPALQFGARTAR